MQIHFEPSQLELHRFDGVIKPKPNGVPTLFNIPNPLKSSTQHDEHLKEDAVLMTQAVKCKIVTK